MSKKNIKEATKIAKKYNKTSNRNKNLFSINLNSVITQIEDNKNVKFKVLNVDLNEISSILGNEISGILYIPDENEVKIFIEQTDKAFRKRFTLAHEIGHYLLGHIDDKKSISFRKEITSDFDKIKDEQEQEANAFAVELLMPEELIKNHKKDIIVNDKYLEYANLFGVSVSALKMRLSYL